MGAQEQKHAAAVRALDAVTPGMKLGLGTGSTAALFVEALGARVADGLDVICVPTSEATAHQALALDIPLASLDELVSLDLTVDGADEVDNRLRLIKGGGGALLREKIVAAASRKMIVIADESKLVAKLGRFPLPVEVVPFAAEVTAGKIADAAAAIGTRGPLTLRTEDDGAPFLTDGGHYIYDCAFGEIADPGALAQALNGLPGVVDHGLFIGLASQALIGTDDGVREINRMH